MSMPPDQSGDGLQAQILLELGKLSITVAVIDTKLTDLASDRADHESRLRQVERALPGRYGWFRDLALLTPMYALVIDLIVSRH